MKKKIILGFLAVILLLFFITSSWALDYKTYLKLKYLEHPEQDFERVPIIPQTVETYSSMIKFISVANFQNIPVVIYVENSSTEVSIKTEESIENTNSTLNKIDRLK